MLLVGADKRQLATSALVIEDKGTLGLGADRSVAVVDSLGTALSERLVLDEASLAGADSEGLRVAVGDGNGVVNADGGAEDIGSANRHAEGVGDGDGVRQLDGARLALAGAADEGRDASALGEAVDAVVAGDGGRAAAAVALDDRVLEALEGGATGTTSREARVGGESCSLADSSSGLSNVHHAGDDLAGGDAHEVVAAGLVALGRDDVQSGRHRVVAAALVEDALQGAALDVLVLLAGRQLEDGDAVGRVLDGDLDVAAGVVVGEEVVQRARVDALGANVNGRTGAASARAGLPDDGDGGLRGSDERSRAEEGLGQHCEETEG